MIERESSKYEYFIVSVKKTDSDTLLPIIRDHILTETIVSDCLRAYNCKPQYVLCVP